MGEIHKAQVRNSNKKYISIKDKVGFAILKSSSGAKLAKYGKVVGCVSLSVSALKIAATGDVQVSDV